MGKKTGVRKLKVEKKGGGGKRKPWRQGELNRRCAYRLLNSPMPYPLPNVPLQLHCELFLTFIVYANVHAQCDVQHTHKQNYIKGLYIPSEKRACN